MLLRLGGSLLFPVNLKAGKVNRWWIVLRLRVQVLLSEQTATLSRFILIDGCVLLQILRLSGRGALCIGRFGHLNRRLMLIIMNLVWHSRHDSFSPLDNGFLHGHWTMYSVQLVIQPYVDFRRQSSRTLT